MYTGQGSRRTQPKENEDGVSIERMMLGDGRRKQSCVWFDGARLHPWDTDEVESQ